MKIQPAAAVKVHTGSCVLPVGSCVNTILPGKAGSALWAASAWGLSHCQGWHGCRVLCQAGESPEEWVGAPELKVGGGNAFLGAPGLIPALHLKLKQVPNCKGKFGQSGKSFCAWKWEVVPL